MAGRLDQPQRHALKLGSAEGVSDLKQNRLGGDETAPRQRELTADLNRLCVPLIILVAERNESGGVDENRFQ